MGISGYVSGTQHWHIGSAAFMQSLGIGITPLKANTSEWHQQGCSVLFTACDNVAVAALGISDRIKPSSYQAVSGFHDQNLSVVMISGDNQQTSEHIAKQLGIDTVISGVLPSGKVSAIAQLQRDNRKVVYVGDGINDAPALASADVSIAIGSGSGIAVESADIVLMSDNLQAVNNALRISAKTMRNIRQNLGWAFAYNVLLIPVAAGVLYPFYGILLSPMFAAAAMAMSSVFVVSNALRLRSVPSIQQDSHHGTHLSAGIGTDSSTA